MTLKHWARKQLWKLGYDVVEYRPDLHPLARRRRLLERAGVDAVLDVGANIGQFAMELRADLGWRGRIVSFEPLAAAHAMLAARAAEDGRWDAHPYALGDRDGSARIGVAGNSYSSSLNVGAPAYSGVSDISSCSTRTRASVACAPARTWRSKPCTSSLR